MKNTRQKRGVLLVFVLATAMLIGVIGLSALMAARVQCRDSVAEGDALAAQWYAQAAIEVALEQIGSTANWRTSNGPGSWFTNRAIDRGTMSLAAARIADADADDYNNDWLLTATGVCGSATRQVQYRVVQGAFNGGYQQVVSTVVPTE